MKKGIFLAKSLAFIGAGAEMAKAAEGRANYMTAEDIEAQANAMSSYSGGGYSGYSGAGDDYLDFGGDNGSFVDSISKGRIYILSLTNANAATRTALLCPGLISTATGLAVDGAFNDVSGAAGLSANGQPYGLNYWNASIQRFPTRILGFKIASSNVAQFDQALTIKKDNPFREQGSDVIQPSVYASEANPNAQLLTVNYEFQMDNETRISYPVLGNTQVNITFVVGALLKTTTALTRKAAVGSVAKFIGR